MTFQPIPCHESLQPFIRNYWLLTSRCVGQGYQRIFSNGATSLHFYLSQSVRLDSGERLFRTALNRHDLTCMEIHCEEGDFNVLGVEFVPFCSRLFFETKDDEKHHLTPQDIGEQDFITLEEQIHSAKNIDEQRQLLDDFFCQRLTQIPINEVNMERLEGVFDGIVPSHGGVSHSNTDFESLSTSDLAETACLSPKQFTRVFSQYVGMNPKSCLRLLRFHKALQELHSSSSHELLTEVAWRCGYYDLAHMTNDFRQLCGHTPSEIQEIGMKLTETFGADFSGKMKKKILMENLE